MMKLKDQAIGTLRNLVLEHRDEDVRDIVEIPAIRARFEALWPLPIAATHFYRHKVRNFIASEVGKDGVRSFVSVEQLALMSDSEAGELQVVTTPRSYVSHDELLADAALVRSHLTSVHRLIMGIVRRSQLPNETKTRLMTAIDEVFRKAA